MSLEDDPTVPDYPNYWSYVQDESPISLTQDWETEQCHDWIENHLPVDVSDDEADAYIAVWWADYIQARGTRALGKTRAEFRAFIEQKLQELAIAD